MNRYLKYAVPLLIICLLGWFLLRHGISWNDLQSVLRRATWDALLLALVCQAASYGAVTYLNQILLQSYGCIVPFRKQLVVQLAMAFIESLVPSASLSGVVLRARLLKSDGVSADVATATVLTEGTLIFASVVLPTLLIAGFAIFNGISGFYNLRLWLAFFTGMVILIVMTIWQWKAQAFSRFRTQLQYRISLAWERNFQSRWPQHFGTWSAQRVIQRIRYLWDESIASLRNRPYAILISLITRSGFEALCLMMCFYALGQRLPVVTLLLVYSLTIAINTVGAIPGGVGLAEVFLSALYTRLGIAAEIAVSIALAYRVVGYWLPRAAGGLAWLWLEQVHLQPSNSEVAP